MVYGLSKILILEWVGNTPITRLQLYRNLSAEYDLIYKPQFTAEKLVESEARRQNIYVTDDVLNERYSQVVEQLGGKESFARGLEISGIPEGEYKKSLKIRILIEELFGKDVSVEDNEIKEYLEKNKSTYPQANDVESFMAEESSDSSKLKSDTANLLRQNKINKNFSDWIQDPVQRSKIRLW
jgi:hypothetical protein